MPYSKALERETMPTVERIIKAIEQCYKVRCYAIYVDHAKTLSDNGRGNDRKWQKKEGDFVKAGEVLLEVATDKATVEHSALDEGWLRKISFGRASRNCQSADCDLYRKKKRASKVQPEGVTPQAQPAVAAPRTINRSRSSPSQSGCSRPFPTRLCPRTSAHRL